jgi:hypothetical protein
MRGSSVSLGIRWCLVAIILSSSVFFESGDADCCGWSYIVYPKNVLVNRTCADGSEGTPCGGYRDCNIFCCNCDGGCREESKRKRSAIFDDGDDGKFGKVLDISQWMDKDGDGKVTEGEATIYLERMGLSGFDKNSSFAYFDKNKDGFLSVKEISSS